MNPYPYLKARSNPEPYTNPNCTETRQAQLDVDVLKDIADKAQHEVIKVRQKAERKINQLERRVEDAVESREVIEASYAQKTRDFELLERTGAKERRQLEIDKAALAEQMTVARNEADRLKTRSADLRNQRLNLKLFRRQGQYIIDKAVEEQREATETNTQVLRFLLVPLLLRLIH